MKAYEQELIRVNLKSEVDQNTQSKGVIWKLLFAAVWPVIEPIIKQFIIDLLTGKKSLKDGNA
jgi:hypothetical protein